MTLRFIVEVKIGVFRTERYLRATSFSASSFLAINPARKTRFKTSSVEILMMIERGMAMKTKTKVAKWEEKEVDTNPVLRIKIVINTVAVFQ